MAKYQSDAMLDAALTWLQDNVKAICILTSEPTTISHCTASTVLATHVMTTADFTLADDTTVGGRKVTVAQQATLAVQTTGEANHVALFSSVAASSGLHYVVTCTTQILGSTDNEVTIPAFDITIDDTT